MSSRPAPAAGIRLGKWVGLLVGPAAWFGHQQIMSSLISARCSPGAGEAVIITGVVSVVAAGIAALLAWRARGMSTGAETHARVDRFVATMSLAIASISALVIVFASAAGIFLECQR